MTKIVIVIPVYNECIRIEKVIQNILKCGYTNIVAIDDCSTDGTSKVLKQLPVKLLSLDKNMGAGYATRLGCDFAFEKLHAEIIVTVDGDGQHAPEDIHKLVNLLMQEKLDIVYGYRPRKKNMPWPNKLGNLILSKLSHLLFDIKLTDTLTGFHAFTSQAYSSLRWSSNRYEFVSEFVYKTYKHNLMYGEVPVQTIYIDDKSGMKIKDGINSILQMIKWRFNP